MVAGEKYGTAKVQNGRGYVSGHNSYRIASYAQQFRQTSKTTLSAFAVGIGKSVSAVNNSNSVVDFQIYQTDLNTGMPGTILKTVEVPIKSLSAQGMHLVVLDKPLDIFGEYFIGYDINYYNSGDTVAVIHANDRTTNDLNRAFCKIDKLWQPFYWVPEIGLRTSLLINAYGCGTTLAQPNIIPGTPGSSRFKVYYPTDPGLNLLYLINTGNEEFGSVIFYDMLGRKISETQRMLTTAPMELNCGLLESAVYCIAVETLSGREVIKVRFVRKR